MDGVAARRVAGGAGLAGGACGEQRGGELAGEFPAQAHSLRQRGDVADAEQPPHYAAEGAKPGLPVCGGVPGRGPPSSPPSHRTTLVPTLRSAGGVTISTMEAGTLARSTDGAMTRTSSPPATWTRQFR